MKVFIALSAALTRWLCGSIDFSLILSFSRYLLTDLEAKLSMMLNTDLKPLFVRYVMFSLKAAIIEVSDKYFTGVANIAFYDQSYCTNISVFPSINMVGDFPVKLTYMVTFLGFSVTWYTNRWFSLSVAVVRCRYLLVFSISNAVLIFSLVLQIPFFLYIWPFSVDYAESGRYFWTARAVKPVHVEKHLLLISFRSVCFGGLNAAW